MTRKRKRGVFRYWPEGHSDETFYNAINGDEKAREVVIEAFKPMVHMWAHEYSFMCSEGLYEDLVQEGVIGILKAIDTFDTSHISKSTGEPIKPCTWIWWKTRAEVQGAAKKFSKFSKHLAQGFDNSNLDEFYNSDQREGYYVPLSVDDLLIEGCGALNNKKASIIRDKFGLNGKTPLKTSEIAAKHGMSDKTAEIHVRRFAKNIRSKYPTLMDYLSATH